MRGARITVVLSFLASAALLIWSLLASNGMQAQLRQDAFGTYAGLIAAAVVLGWPWFGTFFAATTPAAAGSAMVFACMAAAISVVCAALIVDAPAEGVGWYIIICFFFVWLLYLLTSRLRRSLAQ